MRGSGSGGAGAASLTRLSCDADETLKRWAAWSSVPGSAARERESVVTLEQTRWSYPRVCSSDTEFVPLPDRLVSAVATGRPELNLFKRETDLGLLFCGATFSIQWIDGRYINIRYTMMDIVASCSLTDIIVQ